MRLHIRRLLFLVAFVCFFGSSAVSAQESLLPTLQALRGQYPTPMSREQIGELLTRVAQSAPGYVLLRKPQGANCPAVNMLVACDYLVYAPSGQGFDVFQDVEGLAVPTWNDGDSFTADRYVAVPTSGTNVPTPGDPPLSSGDVDALVDLLAEHDLATRAGIDSLRAQIAALKFPDATTPAPVPEPEGGYWTKGKTWGVDVPIWFTAGVALFKWYQATRSEAK